MGHYPPAGGSIAVCGRPLRSYALLELRNLFAFVPQDAYLYSCSVRDNIRYGKPGAPDEAVSAAAARRLCARFDPGTAGRLRYAGGRAWRPPVRRAAPAHRHRTALLKDAPILLLDEATSALDSEAEQLVQQALAALMAGRTTLVIAHRLSTIENADVIYVIEEGRAVEQGRHAELLAAGGTYRRLYELQFRQTLSANQTRETCL